MSKETNRARFVRVAESRTNRVLEDLRLLGNCSTRTNYLYSDVDVKKIFDAIEKEVKQTKARFSKDTSEERFTLE